MTPSISLKTALIAAACAAAPLAATSPALAQSAADFYKGTTLNLLMPTAAGSGYDFDGRFVGRHIGKHLPGNPNVVAQNMPGAGGVRVANALYNTAAQDGSNLGLVMNSAAMMQVIKGPGVQYDVSKMQWIGAVSPAVDTMAVWHTQKIASVDDATKITSVAAATGKGANSSIIPSAMNELLGTKFKVVTGYSGSSEMNLAMERGEVGARGTSWASWVTNNMDWIDDKKIVLIGYAGPRPSNMPAGVPSLVELAKSEDDKRVMELVFSGTEFGRPFVMGPKVPADRVKAMRAAFEAMTKDADFIAEAQKIKVDVEPVKGETLQTLAGKLLTTPDPLVARAKALVE
jgi:tripartite-type tricarboxylate transporter receptor subunit TctC